MLKRRYLPNKDSSKKDGHSKNKRSVLKGVVPHCSDFKDVELKMLNQVVL